MNIYNNSTIGNNTYPTNAVFTGIETSTLQVDSTFIIQGAQKGGILVCEDNNNDIGEINLGTQNMALVSDKNNTGLPIWTDSVTLNSATLNGLNLNGVLTGDLLVGSGGGAVGRLPIGTADYALFSNGSTVGWQSLTALNQYLTFAGSANNILQASNPIASSSSMTVTNGRRYKIHITGNLITSVPVSLSYSIAASVIETITFTGSNAVAITHIFTAASTGNLLVTLAGFTGVVTLATILNIKFIMSEF